jgi:hypothetical protein
VVSNGEAEAPVRVRESESEDVSVVGYLDLLGQFKGDVIVRVLGKFLQNSSFRRHQVLILVRLLGSSQLGSDVSHHEVANDENQQAHQDVLESGAIGCL